MQALAYSGYSETHLSFFRFYFVKESAPKPRKSTYQLFHVNYTFTSRMRKYDKEEIFDCLLIKDHLWKAYEKVKDIKAQAKHMY